MPIFSLVRPMPMVRMKRSNLVFLHREDMLDAGENLT